jgi:hypothetical protein
VAGRAEGSDDRLSREGGVGDDEDVHARAS